MSQHSARQAIRSDARVVVIIAPAGCGKTYEAVAAAIDLAASLPSGREVLLLAHTNAAIDVFRARLGGGHQRVRALTFDALARELVEPFAPALDLPSPLRLNLPGGVPFSALAPKLGELLQRAPAIARVLASHYPVVILDEHQDARLDQHEIVRRLLAAGVRRIRIFTDPMQAIYGFRGEQLLDWDALRAEADAVESLDEPHRWTGNPELGRWLLDARAALEGGDPIPLRGAPPSVTVEWVDGADDVKNPSSRQVTPAMRNAVSRALSGKSGTVAVLMYNNDHAVAMRIGLGGTLSVNEGADLGEAHKAVAKAEAAVGAPGELVAIAMNLLQYTCTGITKPIRDHVTQVCQADAMTMSRKRIATPLIEQLTPIYESPNLATWARVVVAIAEAQPLGVRVHLPASFRALKALGSDASYERFEELVGLQRASTPAARSTGTIHKAKGLEFDHVVFAHCSATPFPDTPDARRRMYVAMSRASKTLHILASGNAPSPLLPARPTRLSR